MAGTRAGGIKARETNLKKYGPSFYADIGRMGGSISTMGGFASLKVGKDGLTGPERARMVAGIGGRKGSRKGVKNGEGKRRKNVY